MTLDRKLKRREGIRDFFLSLVKETQDYLSQENNDEAKLLAYKATLSKIVDQLSTIDDEVAKLIEPDDLKADVIECMRIVLPVAEIEAMIDLKLSRIAKEREPDPDASVSLPSPSISSNSSVSRLPKIELPVFKGDPLKWQGFWDQFSTSIHNNERINDIDRFNFLKRYLGGEALDSIAGLTLSSDNYKEALDILRERYGNEQVLISAHMQSLLKIQKIRSRDNIKSLRTLYNHIESCVRNLKALNLETKGYGSLLIPLLKEKLPDELKILISRKFGGSIWTLDLLLQYFKEELRAQENCTQSLLKSERSDDEDRSVYSASGLFSQTESFKCIFCKKSGHTFTKCNVITNSRSRKDLVFKEGRCFVCLQTGHSARACKIKYSCRKCNGRHNIAICDDEQRWSNEKNHGKRSSMKVQTNQTSADTQISKTENPSNCCSCSKVKNPEQAFHSVCAQVSSSVLLQTATGDIVDTESQNCVKSRLLFDTGSQRSYITTELQEKLSLKVIRKENVIIKTFGDLENTQVKRLDVVKFKVMHRKSRKFIAVEALCVPEICSPIANQRLKQAKNLDKFVNLEFADFCKNYDLGVGILIGIDFYFRFFTGKRIESNKGVIASESTLGWVLSGSLASSSQHEAPLLSHQMRIEVQKVDCDLTDSLHKFWQIEETNEDDSSVIDQFTKDIFHDGTRYVTKLPFKPEHESLPDNFSTCLRRLDSLENKLKRQNIASDYDKVFKEYEKTGIIERVPDLEVPKDDGTVHYLPHRPVVREDKTTTKIRAVFDASCSTNGVSLNDCLYSGPNLLAKIFDILLRFRFNEIGILADIKQAFLNVRIHSDHKDYLRFLWRDFGSIEREVIVYRFTRVVFGLTSSPFLLNGTIRHHLQKHANENLDFVEKFLSDLYVDDTTSGCTTVSEGKYFYEKANSIMAEGGFELRKWTSNNSELQSFFDDKEHPVMKSVEDDNSFAKSQFHTEYNCKRVLGIEWDVVNDELVFRFEEFVDKGRKIKLTKRNILSVSSSIYDPLGIVSPVTARIKTIFQLICKGKGGWDEIVCPDIAKVWLEFLEALDSVKVLKIKRFTFISHKENVRRVELHGFCDSSKFVYCAVVYLRVVTDNDTKIFFLSSKNKVAPLKELSIPRLELLGCVLLSNLIRDVKAALESRISLDYVHCWTDSNVALCWIKGNRKSWKPWIENRVVSIRKEVSKCLWHHIPGEYNPADIPTRMVSEFRDAFDSRWFLGPEMFLDSEVLSRFLFVDTSGVNSEEKSNVLSEARKALIVKESDFFPNSDTKLDNDFTEHDCLLTETNADVDLSKVMDISRYSSLRKLLEVTAYVIRFIGNLKAKVRKDNLVTEEIITLEEKQHALSMWIIEEQRIAKLHPNFKKNTKSLGLLAENNIIRLRGRFANAAISKDEKYPILLRDVSSRFTQLVIWNAHEKTLHHGIESTLAQVRKMFWITRGRKAVKNTIRKCVICIRSQGKTLRSPVSPDLPDFRLGNNERAFNFVGLDFAGPLFFRNFSDCNSCNKNSFKCYILLLTCATTRAIHLELVPDMSEPSFLKAFKRFVARRGTPSLIVSDNFKTFKSVEIKRFMSNSGIKQHFILPASPWWGGFYERLVRSVKMSLKKVLGRSFLKYEELETTLVEIESTINSRPLTYVNEDDFEPPLTPNHLIFGSDIHDNASSSAQVITSYLPLKRLRHLNLLLNHYRKRFISSYLNELRQVHIYRRQESPEKRMLHVNDVVLVKDDIPLPRNKWKIGRIASLVTGKDGHIRGAVLDIITKTGRKGSIHRPITKLIPFEITSTTNEKIAESQPPSSTVATPSPSPSTVVTPSPLHDNSNDRHDKRTGSRVSSRKAAKEGQYERRIKEKYG